MNTMLYKKKDVITKSLLIIVSITVSVAASLNITILFLLLSLTLMIFLVIYKNSPKIVIVSFFLVLSFLPSTYVSLFRFNSPLGELRPSMVIIPIAILLAFLVQIRKKNFSLINENKPIIIIFIIAMSINIIVITFRINFIDSFRQQMNTYLLSFGVLMMIILCDKIISAKATMKVFIFASSIVSTLGIVEFFGIQPYLKLYLIDRTMFYYDNRIMDGLPRVVASMGNPLILSGYLLICFPIALYLRETEKNKVLWNFVICLHALAILLTMSRSAIMILLILTLFYLFRNMNTLKIALMFLLTVGVGLVLFGFLNYFGLVEYFQNRIFFQTESESFYYRIEAFALIFKILKYNLLFGIGLNGITEFLKNFAVISTLDNTFLTVLGSDGVIGFIMFILPFVYLVKKFSKFNGFLKFTGMSLLFIFAGMGFSYGLIYYESVWGVLWIFIALVLLREKEIRDEH
ncbi:O-antigen ligase [Clostridium sp.]|uniref:O-antigen ligase family protein n=1 Tax=Clostridium sp. TaxID=1506 RepID=UPI001A53CF84|nr:O-antigen ligase family protein [Clostridium sp.]MBK5243360.1 O-antigen ligase family protein [Clostridium sp.]